ncbi:hypothetical protein [Sphingomonas beigongshangi]|uniref:hypothetical protein n=1 Tax=Sphingomonas beigongshangi TaxID=2782540 RepID=UPI00193BF50D|nr:hypothetical protein [Sphingomonas beigongshangi]
MSDFRRFCIGFTVMFGLLATFAPSNATLDQIARRLIVSIVMGSGVVACFGRQSHVEREG